ncbi:MAG: sugar ABC transporter substrate-binding protein [Candidatus Omnitrophota bacterium]|nr:sugar ABC transporter substrate-binding protein [Candidatus Omnitrophota bacterium]
MRKPYTSKKSVIISLGIVCVIFSLIIWGAGCGPSSTKPTVKISIWGSTSEVDIITKVVDEWQKEHPDVVARIEHTPGGSYTNKLLIRVAGGTAPDVMFVEVAMFVNFWAMDAFMDLKPLIAKDASFDLNDFFPEVVDRFTRDGKLYCLPRDTAPIACVYYNKKLFDEAGVPYPTDDWNWHDLLEKAEKLTVKTDNVMEARYGYYGWTWHNFIYSNGGSFVDNVKNPTRFTMNEKKAIEGLQFYTDLINKYEVSPSPVELGNLGMGAQQLFMSGKLAMFQSGFWENVIFKDIQDFDWDVVMFPKGPSGIRGFETGGSGYCILKSTKYPELAWEIVKLLSGEKAQIALADFGLAQPAIKSIAAGPHFAESSKPPLNKGMLNEAVKYAVYSPFHAKWREINELYLGPELDLVFNGKESVEKAMAKVEPEANKLLKAKD